MGLICLLVTEHQGTNQTVYYAYLTEIYIYFIIELLQLVIFSLIRKVVLLTGSKIVRKQLYWLGGAKPEIEAK